MSELAPILPWHNDQWQPLMQAILHKRLPHALLFTGTNGLGKKHFALSLAQAILCVNPAPSGACKTCYHCNLTQAQTHSGLILIEPLPQKQVISVEQIREVVSYANETTLQGDKRVFILHPAVAMNLNAANALLKTLEEPAQNTWFILIAERGGRLPATIRSRCQTISFPVPSEMVALSWLQSHEDFQKQSYSANLLLKLAFGAPCQVLFLLKKGHFEFRKDLYQNVFLISQKKSDPVKLAAAWHENDLLMIVDLLLMLLADILRYKLASNVSYLINQDFAQAIISASQHAAYSKLLAYYGYLQQIRSNLLTSISLNKQLLLEEIFIQWGELCS